MLPNFLIVGAEKGGTTTLAAALAVHPDVYMSPVKEVRFFSHHWDKGVAWYEQFFAEARVEGRGEASPAYTWYPRIVDVPRRIYKTLGDIKYIYIVRNPVERAISHYRHSLYARRFPATTTFEQALELRPDICDCSRYYYQLEQYLPYTDRLQWLIITLEELYQNAPPSYTEVFRFLEVDTSFQPPLQTLNVTDGKKITPTWLTRFSRKLGSVTVPLPSAVKKKLKRAATDLFGKTVRKPQLAPALHARLVGEFIPDVERLSVFYEKDFVKLWNLK